MEKAMIALINALVEERAHFQLLKSEGLLSRASAIEEAKKSLQAEFKAYPEVQF